MQREKLGSTGVGNGVAIPHGKLPKLTSCSGCLRGSTGRSISNRSTGSRSI